MIAQYGMQPGMPQSAGASNFIPSKRPAKRVNAND
jgi:hypothetical protein